MKNFPDLITDHAPVIFLALVFLAAGILRLNDHSLLTPDSTLYLIWGNSLAHGEGFVDATPPEPDHYVSRGPLYALLLAPVQWLFPLSIVAAKVWTLLLGVCAILLFYNFLQRRFDRTKALAGAMLFALNPLVLVYSTEILSEIAFLIVIFATLILMERHEEMRGSRRTVNFLFLALMVAGMALIREVGIAMLAALVIYFLSWKDVKHAVRLIVICGIIVGIWYMRNLLLVEKSEFSQTGNLLWFFQRVAGSSDASLVSELLSRVWMNFTIYWSRLGGMVLLPLFDTAQLDPLLGAVTPFYRALHSALGSFKLVIVLVVTPLILLGLYSDLRTNTLARVRALFLFLYLGIIFFFPFNDIRYLLPVAPFIIYYLALAMLWIVEHRALRAVPARKKRLILAGIIGLVMLPNTVGLSHLLTANYMENQAPSQPWEQFGQWIAAWAPEDVTIASPVKDLAAVIVPRKTLDLDPAVPTPRFEALLRDHHVEYILSPLWSHGLGTYELLMLESQRYWFEPVHQAGALHLFKVHSAFEEPAPAAARQVRIDTLAPNGLLLLGRLQLLREEYAAAERSFTKALALSAGRQDILYQLVVTKALEEDSAGVRRYFDKLLRQSSEVGIYLHQSRFQMDVLRALQQARAEPTRESRAVQAGNVATAYWSLGYYRRAASIMDQVLEADSTYFMGLLWGFHYNYRTGERDEALSYLAQAGRMDSLNTIVQTFREVALLGDSLLADTSSGGRSRLRLELARAYQSMELVEDALDEAQRALGENPSNVDALLFLAERFEQRARPRTAEKLYRRVRSLNPGLQLAIHKSDSLQQVLQNR